MMVLSTKQLSPLMISHAKSIYGFTINCIPFTKISPVDFLCSPDTIHGFDVIAFTSPNAVRNFLEKPDIRDAIAGKVIVALEGETKNELYQYKLSPAILAPNARSLGEKIELLNKHKTVHKVLHPTGNLALPHLREEVLKAGCEYHGLQVYKTELCPVAVDAQSIQVVLFFSPSAIDSFAIANRFLTNRLYVCIGQTTYNRLRYYSLEASAIMSKQPTPESMLMALQNYVL
jgi:uroporphyrinogen-III synthase